MKFCKTKIDECVVFVEKNGLFPQAHGASVSDFIKAVDIDFKTYQRWMENANFSSALTRAREVFRQNTVVKYSNKLMEVALGFSMPKEKTEFKDKKGRPVPVKKTIETVYFPPNIEALKFGLTNLDPEHWKVKQDTDVSLDIPNENPPVIVFEKPKEEE